MVSRIHRTYGLARRVAAMLAHHRHEAGVEIGAAVFPALVVPLDTNPRHLSAAQDIRAETSPVRKNLCGLPIGADSWNVVFRVARAHARRAPGTPREIDGHRPPALGHAAPVI